MNFRSGQGQIKQLCKDTGKSPRAIVLRREEGLKGISAPLPCLLRLWWRNSPRSILRREGLAGAAEAEVVVDPGVVLCE